jgi:MOSC domain-containing protein YiiM
MSVFESIDLLATSTGLIKRIGEHSSGRTVYSAIGKTQVPEMTTELFLGYGGLQGDQQADLRPLGLGKTVHGGPSKAVYVFPGEHYEHIATRFGIVLPPGSFGENWTTLGALESDVHPGEIWLINGVRMQAEDYRRPCFKLDMHLGPGASERMVLTGYTGWYMRVLRNPGPVPTRGVGVIQIKERILSTPSVLESFRTKMRKVEGAIPDLHVEN